MTEKQTTAIERVVGDGPAPPPYGRRQTVSDRTDLLTRLTLLASGARWQDGNAADTIEEARDEIERLREAAAVSYQLLKDGDPCGLRHAMDTLAEAQRNV